MADAVLRLRYQMIEKACPQLVIVSGSVGKTIMRRALHHTFVQNKKKSFTLDTDYVNEFGLLLSLFGIKKFHFWSMADWVLLLRTRPITGYVVIEMGADFRNDILWFLRYFKPAIVVLTQGTDIPWTGRVKSVLEERMLLAKHATECVFVSSLDTVHRRLLLDTNVRLQIVDVNSSDDIYGYPLALAARLGCDKRDYIQEQCSTNRLTITDCHESLIFLDQYKVTPVCLSYILSRALNEEVHVRVLIMNEIRPLPVDFEIIYEAYIPMLQKFEKILYRGDGDVYRYLLSRLQNFELLNEMSADVTMNFLQQVNSRNQKSLVVVKTSSHYKTGPEARLLQSLVKGH